MTWIDLFSRKLSEHFLRYVRFVIFYCLSSDSFDKLMLIKRHFDIVFFLTTFVFHHSILESQKQWNETHISSISSRNYSVKKSQFRWNYWSTYFFCYTHSLWYVYSVVYISLLHLQRCIHSSLAWLLSYAGFISLLTDASLLSYAGFIDLLADVTDI